MVVDYKHFPHPVLSNDRDDYIESSFDSSLEINHIADKLEFKVNCSLKNDDIKKLIIDGKANIIYRIESPQTMYRDVYNMELGDNKFYINENCLKGKITVESYIVAMKDINDFRSEDFHGDYEDLTFNLIRSDILAIGEKNNFRLDKDIEELYNIPSIFLISRVDDENQDMRISFEGDKINILLCNEDYINQQNLSNIPKYQPILHSMIIMPALIYLFTELRDEPYERFEELSEKRWFKSLDSVLRKVDLSLDQFDIRQETPYKLAQLILDYPLKRGLYALSIKDEVE